MIRYLYSKVNLWEGKHFFFMMEDKMIYQAGCLENTPKKGDRLLFLEERSEKVQKMGPGPISCAAPFLVSAEKVACLLF